MSILDRHPGDPAAVQFDDLANALLEQGEMLSPAELHGCLCGLLGGGLGAAGRSKNDFEALLAGLESTLDLSLHGDLADAVDALHQELIECLTEGTFDFHPLLPGDDLELSQRTIAMAGWCRGFLSGYAQARVQADAQGQAVAPDSAEALRDFAAIAQADSDDDERDEDDAEADYIELLEYLRVAALNVLADAAQDFAAAPPETAAEDADD